LRGAARAAESCVNRVDREGSFLAIAAFA
jgi:hypothetical protein